LGAPVRSHAQVPKMTHSGGVAVCQSSECRFAVPRFDVGCFSTSGTPQTPSQARTLERTEMTKPRIIPCVVAIGLVLGLSACTNPYDPVQRTIGGGLIGAGSGAAIGAAAAGGHGAALGAAVGGAVGAVTGLITTPPPPAYHGYYNHRRYAASNKRKRHCVDCGSTAAAAPTNAPSGY